MIYRTKKREICFPFAGNIAANTFSGKFPISKCLPKQPRHKECLNYYLQKRRKRILDGQRSSAIKMFGSRFCGRQTKLLREETTCCTPLAVYAIFSHMPWRSLHFQLCVLQESISVHQNIIVTLSSKFPFLFGLRLNEKQTMSSLLSLCWKGKVKPRERFEWNVKLHEVKFIQFSFRWRLCSATRA